MEMAEAYREELDRLVELAGIAIYGNMDLRKRIIKLLGYKGKVKTPYEIRKEWSSIKGSMAEEVIKMRQAE
jgi:endonuclease V-like protein UPF0215 family